MRDVSPEETLDVIDLGSPGVDASLLRTIAAVPDRGRVLVLGSGRDAARVEGEGLGVAAWVPVSKAAPRLWTARLRQFLEGVGHRGVLRTWSEPALVAALGIPDVTTRLHASVVAVATRPPLVEPWLRRRVQVHAVGEDLGPRLFRRGWRLGSTTRLSTLPSAVLPSEPIRRTGGGREELVVAVATSPHSAIDARQALDAAAAVVVAGRAITVVLSPRQPGWSELGRWACGFTAASASRRLRVVVDDRVDDPRRAATDVDLVMMPIRQNRRGDCSLVTARAWLAAGVPLMAPATRGLAALVEDGVDGRLLSTGSRNAFARAMLRVADDRMLLEDMSHAAAARHGGRRSISSGVRAQDTGSSAAKASAAVR